MTVKYMVKRRLKKQPLFFVNNGREVWSQSCRRKNTTSWPHKSYLAARADHGTLRFLNATGTATKDKLFVCADKSIRVSS